MINPNVHETAALLAASAAGGAFIEAMPSADLSTWSAEDWHRLIDVIVTGFQDSLRAAYADDPPI